MKLFFILISLLTFIFGEEPADRGYIVQVGDECPDFILHMMDGSTLSKSDLKGNVVVLQFTGSWCSVCRKEMPHLEKDVWQRFKNEDFILIGIDINEPKDVVKQFIKEMKTTYPIALDEDYSIFHLFAYKGAGVTRNIVLDKNGKIVYLTRLFEQDEFNAMIAKIEELLSENKPLPK